MKTSKYVVAILAGLTGITLADVSTVGYTHLAGWVDFAQPGDTGLPDYLIPSGFSATASSINTGYGVYSPPISGNSEGVLGNSDWEIAADILSPPSIRNGAVQLDLQPATFAITKTTQGTGLDLIGYLLFDAQKESGTPSIKASWAVSGPSGPSAGTIATVSGFTTTSDYTDFSYDLSPLGIWLDNGDTITFTFESVTGGAVHLDNIGVTLGVIPEPGSLIALGCFLGSGLLIRRNRRNLA